MGKPKSACPSPSKKEALAPVSKDISAPVPSSPVTPRVSFPFAGAPLADDSYQDRSSVGALNVMLPEIALESDSMSFMSILPPPVEDSSCLLHRPESAELELPFNTFPGIPGGDEDIAWDDIRDVESLSLHGFVV